MPLRAMPNPVHCDVAELHMALLYSYWLCGLAVRSALRPTLQPVHRSLSAGSRCNTSVLTLCGAVVPAQFTPHRSARPVW